MSRAFELPPLQNWQDFEDLCLELWKQLWNDPNAQKNGRGGQSQAGVDIFGQPDGGQAWEGVQCKLKSQITGQELTEKEIRSEVEKAKTFRPGLSRFIIATTAPADAKAQKVARTVTSSGFPVQIYSWNDICQALENQPDIVEKFFGFQRSKRESPFHGVPPATNLDFIGRSGDLELLHNTLESSAQIVALTSRVAIHGGGGIGKTRLASEYAYQYRKYYSGGIFWVSVSTQTPAAVWAELGRRLKAREISQDSDAAQAFFNWLDAESEPILIVLDDLAGEPQRFSQMLEISGAKYPALPTSSQARILITSRLLNISVAYPVHVTRLEKEAAIELLLVRAQRNNDEPEATEKLADQDLVGHPLAVSLAGAYLARVRSLSVERYRERLCEKGLTSELEKAAEHAGGVITDHEQSIAATFRLSHELLNTSDRIDKLALELLDFASFLAPDIEIDPGLLGILAGGIKRKVEEDEPELAVSRLVEISLLEPGCKIHALVADYVRWSQTPKIHVKTCGILLRVTNSLFPINMKEDAWKIMKPGGHNEWEEFTKERFSHLRNLNRVAAPILTDKKRRDGRWLPQLATSLQGIGHILHKRGSHAAAIDELQSANLVLRKLSANRPREKKWQSKLGGSHIGLSQAFLSLGDTKSAGEHMEQAKKYIGIGFKRMSKAHSGVLPKSRQKINRIKRYKEDPAGVLQDTLEASEELLEPTLENAELIYQVARTHKAVADTLLLQERIAEARVQLGAAIKKFEEILKIEPANSKCWLELARAHIALASCMKKEWQESDAMEEYLVAQEILRDITKSNPYQTEWQLLLVYNCTNLTSITMKDFSKTEDTIAFTEEALEVLLKLQGQGRISSIQERMIDILTSRMTTLKRAQENAQADR